MPQARAESIQHSDVINRFEEHAFRRPEAECIRLDRRILSYGKLNDLANRFYMLIKQHGVAPGQPVAVCVERSPELVAALLGVMKAGAAYLPIDPLTPDKRLDFILADAGAASLVITQPELRLRFGARSVLLTSELGSVSLSVNGAPFEGEWAADDLAYVIYTSGSTGRPKGVEILHRSLALSVDSIRRELNVTASDTLLAATSQSFDVSVMEIFLALSSGARLVLFPQTQLMQGELLRTAIEEQGATVLFGTPSLWRLLLEAGWTGNPAMRGVIGGELLDGDLAQALAEKTGAMWNHYGPTETTIVATTYRITSGAGPVPIGFPLPHVHAFIVDGDNRPVPSGEAGELLLGGDILARGYRNHPELTNLRFVQLELKSGASERVYRTGDLVKQRSDGALEFVGRADNQVKLRGFRIELEEIESVLGSHSDITETAIVVYQDGADDKCLVAYYRSQIGKAPTVESLRSYLSARLPLYMVPAHFIELDQFPYLVNGKIDRLALATRALPAFESEPLPQVQSDPVVQELLALWRRILRLPSIQPTDNFFEVGGHSLLAARLFDEIRSRTGKSLPLATLFEAPTVEGLARVIARTCAPEWSPLVPIRTEGAGAPFFCVHPIGGNVLIFKKLSESLKTRRFYGLQARGLDGQEQPNISIEDMAADYLNSVRKVQPHGPYLLGGYSAGGLVAFEMARMLENAGEKVELIVLFDTFLHPDSLPPDFPQVAKPAILKPVTGLSRRLWQMRHLEGEMRLGVVARDIARVWSTIKLKAYTQCQRFGRTPFQLDTVSGFLFALRNYRPRPLAADAMLFLADANAPSASANLPAVWRRLITGKLDVVHLQIDHDRLLDEPSAASVASMIEERFERQPAAH